MGFFKRLRAMFNGGPPQERYLPIYVYSNRCADAMAGRIDLMNELSGADADNAASDEGLPAGAVWFVRKVLTTGGRGRCFDNVEVRVWLNAGKVVVKHEVDGGRWLAPDEYEMLERARASTLEDDGPGGGSASNIDETEKPGGNPNAR
ncbi:MAG: hypothetical protein ACRC1H_18075 [Caldilineaceae bacterium]